MSIIDQTIIVWEIILVVDGPVSVAIDRVVVRTQKQLGPRMRVIRSKENVGLSMAMNLAIDVADGEILARMDADDISEPERFEVQLKFLDDHPHVAMVGAWYEQFTADMCTRLMDRRVPEDHYTIVRLGRYRTPINHVTVMFRSEAARAVGAYPIDDRPFEDWWFTMQLVSHGYNIHNLQQSLVRVRGDRDFFSRRSGVRYLIKELGFMRSMAREGLVPASAAYLSFGPRIIMRLLPQRLLRSLYPVVRRAGLGRASDRTSIKA
jgi:glycosyltransferase involved in cell wall biosynthesis